MMKLPKQRLAMLRRNTLERDEHCPSFRMHGQTAQCDDRQTGSVPPATMNNGLECPCIPIEDTSQRKVQDNGQAHAGQPSHDRRRDGRAPDGARCVVGLVAGLGAMIGAYWDMGYGLIREGFEHGGIRLIDAFFGALILGMPIVIVGALAATIAGEVVDRRNRRARAMRRHPSARFAPDFTSDRAREYHESNQLGRN